MILRLLLMAPLAFFSQSADVPTGVRLSPPAHVPSTVFDRFRTEFPKAAADWARSGEQKWTATFNDDSTHLPRVNVYAQSGELLESRKRLAKGSYPPAIDKYFHSNRPTDDYLVWRHDRMEADTRYYAVTPADTNWFNARGAFQRAVPLERPGDEEITSIVLDLWRLNQMRLSILRVAEKNGFVTNTRQLQADNMDTALRSMAATKNLTLQYIPDEKETLRLRELNDEHGEQLARSVNRELRKNAADMSKGFSRASRSDDAQLVEFAEKFGGPE